MFQDARLHLFKKNVLSLGCVTTSVFSWYALESAVNKKDKFSAFVEGPSNNPDLSASLGVC